MASARPSFHQASMPDKTVKTSDRTTTLESMLKLLLFLETELQFKEEILDLLMVSFGRIVVCFVNSSKVQFD